MKIKRKVRKKKYIFGGQEQYGSGGGTKGETEKTHQIENEPHEIEDMEFITNETEKGEKEKYTTKHM